MILQALHDSYDIMANDVQFDVPLPGYSSQNCSFAIVIDADGELKTVMDLRNDKKWGEQMVVPLQKGRSGKNPPPYFLCENCKYLLGGVYDKKKDDLEPCEKNLGVAAELHEKILAEVDDDGARAILRFFQRRKSGQMPDVDKKDDFYTSGFAVIKLDGTAGYIHERAAVQTAWKNFFEQQNEAEEERCSGQCLITGQEHATIARIHTLTKGVLGGKATGGSLVGFNFDAVASYGKSQSYNAPVSSEAMFRYTTALNTLLARQENRLILGDMSCVFWTEKEVTGRAIDQFKSFFGGEFEDEKELKLASQGAKQIADVLLRSLYGNEISADMLELEKNTTAYILGLAPNAARLSVRFWYKNTFGHFVEHIAEHIADMEIVKSEKAKKFVPVRDLLYTMAVGGKSENVPKTMERALLQAIVSGSLYPAGVYANVLLRIRAEVGDDFVVNRTRAGFIKAYLKRKYRKEKAFAKEEAITVALNEESTNPSYQLGRLFAVLERLQESAGNKNLREKYFASASTNPRMVFPAILKLAQSHLAKVSKGSAKTGVFFDKLCGGILEKLEENNAFPKSLELEEQGMFILGYYHQRQYFYTPKAKTVLEEAEQELAADAE